MCIMQVLDAPSLQDDFYLNLVDWSSQNVLAVGLGTCVYLWSASNSKVSYQQFHIDQKPLSRWILSKIYLCGFQVTKLCDLGPYDGVCSVQWTREGSFISIGTNLGQVQVLCLTLDFCLFIHELFHFMIKK